MTLNEYISSIRDKTIAVLGIGISNLPLIELLCQEGCSVTACDRRTMDQLGETGEHLISIGAKLRLGADYLEGLADEFTSTMNIEKNMRNISSFNEEDTNRVYGQGMNFIFYPTKDNESGKEGYFLLGVYVFDNGSLPKDFPIRLGDSLEKVYEIFGKEPNGERYYLDDGEEIKAWEGWGNICHVEMLVFDNGESHKVYFRSWLVGFWRKLCTRLHGVVFFLRYFFSVLLTFSHKASGHKVFSGSTQW